MLLNLSNALHTLAAAVWVGGMFFAYMALRPSIGGLPPEQALPLWRRTLQRFLRWVALTVILLWATGLYMLFFVFGGFGASWHIDTMFLTALIMTALFFWLNHGPFRRFKKAADAGDFETAGGILQTVRKIVAANLVIGLLTVLTAAWGASG